MKTITRYTWKTGEATAEDATAPEGTAPAATAEPAPVPAETPAPADTAETAAAEPAASDAPDATTRGEDSPATDDGAVEAPAAEAKEPTEISDAAADATPAVPAGPSFDSLEDARLHLLTHARERVVRAVENGRLHGKRLDDLPDGEIKRAIIGSLERQRRFPLDTANALRGRLRREGFTIFKRGSKGVSYVSAVKRKFRVPGQTFAESIGDLIHFIETHPQIKAGELPERFLGISLAVPEGETEAKPVLAPEDQQRLVQLQGDLRWLIAEGYVTEFLDGSLFAPPVMPSPKSGKAAAPSAGEDEDDSDHEDTPAQADAPANDASDASPETPPDAPAGVPTDEASAAPADQPADPVSEAPVEEASDTTTDAPPAQPPPPSSPAPASAPAEPVKPVEPAASPEGETPKSPA